MPRVRDPLSCLRAALCLVAVGHIRPARVCPCCPRTWILLVGQHCYCVRTRHVFARMRSTCHHHRGQFIGWAHSHRHWSWRPLQTLSPRDKSLRYFPWRHCTTPDGGSLSPQTARRPFKSIMSLRYRFEPDVSAVSIIFSSWRTTIRPPLACVLGLLATSETCHMTIWSRGIF